MGLSLYDKPEGSTLPKLDLSFSQSRCDIKFPGGNVVAVMNMKSFRSFLDIQQSSSIRYEGFGDPREWSKCLHSSSEGGDAPCTTIDINIYGYRSESDLVATKLSNAGLFLQEPLELPRDMPYNNPQYFHLFDIPQFEIPYIVSPLSREEQQLDEVINLEVSTLLDFDRILDSLADHDYLDQANAVSQVSASLLCHQKEGLDFITRRETGLSPPSRNLWQLQETGSGAPLFQHVITGAKSPAAKECLGGILADEMGLGKSLTMLAAIAGSMDRAFSYAFSHTNVGSSGQGIIAAKGTLVIVPSAFAADFARKRSFLHQVHWYRIVLDEAHMIRNSSTKQFRAVTSLHSFSRWCLTGTPIQNSSGDLGSLVRFLKLPVLDDRAQFKRHITSKIEVRKPELRPDFNNLRILLESICLRRTKAVLPMSQFTEETYWLDFSIDEREQYSRIERICREALDLAVSGHKVKKPTEMSLKIFSVCDYSAITGPSIPSRIHLRSDFPWILKMFSVCSNKKAKQFAIIAPVKVEPAVTEGHHTVFCHDNYPSKVIALCDNIEAYHGKGKSVVFSFWKKSLDIVGALLASRRIPFLRVDGSLQFSKRKTVLDHFQKDDIPVLLMTLGTGAVGLNSLAVANRIYILEPQWNPSVEGQAIGRVVRLGQEKPVTVVRYLMKNTVEKNVENRQLRKLHLARRGFGAAKMQMLRHPAELVGGLVLDSNVHGLRTADADLRPCAWDVPMSRAPSRLHP
ncbi:hypothetical protein K469DRAFT_772288 [Zopfia rhizophila CBS 207.26]|uniref:P-loop containing nucleoside triphosphate hydrolase protein n=1 Tax=Zopfia rhizophila CBS 207.26 TaxID=1314779 RepID=A0A6A6D8Z5_9PEZI|nr:hypothetical protein K469DRAFT_772288 [Zopfia rhizophila CBS 207.26]